MGKLVLSRERIREVDRLAIEQYGMTGLVLMENAGRGCVDLLCELGIDGTVLIACGRGNNGGDGFVMARHLDQRGHRVRVALFCPSDRLQGDARSNFQILQRCDVPIIPFNSADDRRLDGLLEGAGWIVDALLGTGARGGPRPPLDWLIRRLNDYPARRMAVDIPSGLDCDSGQAAQVTFRADHTCSFVAEKPGFAVAGARGYLGQVHVLDIGAPKRLLEELSGGQ